MITKAMADVMMSIAGVILVFGMVPQIVRVYTLKSASQLSWLYLLSTWVASMLFLLGKLSLGCMLSATTDGILVLGGAILVLQKIRYR